MMGFSPENDFLTSRCEFEFIKKNYKNTIKYINNNVINKNIIKHLYMKKKIMIKRTHYFRYDLRSFFIITVGRINKVRGGRGEGGERERELGSSLEYSKKTHTRNAYF